MRPKEYWSGSWWEYLNEVVSEKRGDESTLGSLGNKSILWGMTACPIRERGVKHVSLKVACQVMVVSNIVNADKKPMLY